MILPIILGIADFLIMPRLLQNFAKNIVNQADQPALEADFPWLDHEKMAFYEREFAQLGFEPRGDWAPPPVNGVRGFMRLMGNEKEQAFVSLHCSKPALGKPQTLKCAINCVLSDGWIVGATDREADPILTQLRAPRSVFLRDCDATPVALWQETQRVRAELQSELNLQRIGDASADSFFKLSAAWCAERAKVALSKNPVAFTIRRRVLMRSPLPRRELYTGEWRQAPPAAVPPIASPGI